eukprot:TRINITY_DN20990_c0_g1_i1.p1 TRINITY_DN20990_c0_g1~~TRINITY_DN20990_c0_g1_i1.p1  ORF type:complete len:516 (-),score=24.40 TRINITY_DN20990_c0_g1_i1:761-2308(-)
MVTFFPSSGLSLVTSNGVTANHKNQFMSLRVTLAAAFCLLMILGSDFPSAAASDLIGSLPGQPADAPFFRQYAGYVPINVTTGKTFFYYLVESIKFPQKAPLVLWLNGGPGCSSLIGFFEEIGPWKITSARARDLAFNPYSWNRVANVLFLEAPTTVGFSTSSTPSDFKMNDVSATADMYTFLLNFIEKYPSYKGRDFYITGESYAGHYIPLTAALILAGQAKGGGLALNFKGIAIGNPATDIYYDALGVFSFQSGHAIVPITLYELAVQYCPEGIFYGTANISLPCLLILFESAFSSAGIDPYDVDGTNCLYQGRSAIDQSSRLKQHMLQSKFGTNLAKATKESQVVQPASAQSFPASSVTDSSCYFVWVTRYLNRLAVQKAIHAVNGTFIKPWTQCNSTIDYTTDVLTVLPTVKALIKSSGLRVWYYSGDADSVVPFDGTARWIDSLNMTTVDGYRPWIDPTGQVGGRVVTYANFTWATVRGAGHEVPKSKPIQAFAFFKAFLTNGTLPAATF